MLILTRKIGETVVVGDDVFITILGVKGNQIRLGFDAPHHVSIRRRDREERTMRHNSVNDVNGNRPQTTPVKRTEAHQYTAH